MPEVRCFKQGDANPADACQMCDASRDPSKWSPRTGGSCDDGNACTRNDYCSNGACKGTYHGDQCSDGYGCTTDQCDGKGGCLGSKLKAGYCLINGACFKDKTKNPTSGCYHCDVSKSIKAWTNRPNSCLASPFVMDGVYVAAAPYGTNNYGKLTHLAQTPPTKNSNGNIDANEILKVALPSLKVVP